MMSEGLPGKLFLCEGPAMSDLGDPFEARKNKGPVHPAQDMDTGAYPYARPREEA